VETLGTGRDPKLDIAAALAREFDLRPAAIIERLGLLRPIYEPTAAYGHFGRTDIALPWEAVLSSADAGFTSTAASTAAAARQKGDFA
jgi:S-adenosylmethionine synthetase